MNQNETQNLSRHTRRWSTSTPLSSRINILCNWSSTAITPLIQRKIIKLLYSSQQGLSNIMIRTSITIKKKLEIIDHFKSTNNKKQTAAHFSTNLQTIYPSQIRKWVNMEQTLGDAAKKKNTKKTIHVGVAPLMRF